MPHGPIRLLFLMSSVGDFILPAEMSTSRKPSRDYLPMGSNHVLSRVVCAFQTSVSSVSVGTVLTQQQFKEGSWPCAIWDPDMMPGVMGGHAVIRGAQLIQKTG